MTGTVDGALDRSELGEALEIRLEMPGYVELVFSVVLMWGFGDALSTLFAATYAGHHLEANPWLRFLLGHQPWLVLALKMAVALYVGIVLLQYRDFITDVPGWRAWLFGVAGFGAIVVVNNVLVGLMAVGTMV